MADFKAGDRVVKMSGFSAGKYGTVNSVLENGTLNVTFDGERLPKYCDPMRCGQVAANANVKVGDKIVLIADAGVWRKGATGAIVGGDYLPGFLYVKFDDGSEGRIPESKMAARNSRAANAVRNAAPSAQLKKAYDEWKKAEAKFKKWFGSGRSLSERIPAGADDTRKKIEFSNLFFKETGRHPPNGYGEMTLEQMMAYNSQKGVRNAVARNGDYDIEKFEVGKVYRAPWDRDWLAKVLSRTPSSIKVAIKSARDKTWHVSDEQVTLRINPRKSEEQGAEVAKGWDWEFWADVKA
ncbi:MAG: hypothetical protein IIZ06_03670 [Kiritimatiellae bacterium]|nr:hypothetical protein [Kiritimatiellia bacterium]